VKGATPVEKGGECFSKEKGSVLSGGKKYKKEAAQKRLILTDHHYGGKTVRLKRWWVDGTKAPPEKKEDS